MYFTEYVLIRGKTWHTVLQHSHAVPIAYKTDTRAYNMWATKYCSRFIIFFKQGNCKKKIQFELNVFIKKDIFKYQEITRFFFLFVLSDSFSDNKGIIFYYDIQTDSWMRWWTLI